MACTLHGGFLWRVRYTVAFCLSQVIRKIIRMKVAVFFAAICIFALAMPQAYAEEGDEPAVREARGAKGVCSLILIMFSLISQPQHKCLYVFCWGQSIYIIIVIQFKWPQLGLYWSK